MNKIQIMHLIADWSVFGFSCTSLFYGSVQFSGAPRDEVGELRGSSNLSMVEPDGDLTIAV